MPQKDPLCHADVTAGCFSPSAPSVTWVPRAQAVGVCFTLSRKAWRWTRLFAKPRVPHLAFSRPNQASGHGASGVGEAHPQLPAECLTIRLRGKAGRKTPRSDCLRHIQCFLGSTSWLRWVLLLQRCTRACLYLHDCRYVQLSSHMHMHICLFACFLG